jgi:hypothetical protein
MKTVRPSTADPIPLRHAAPPIGTVMIRFAGVLIVAAIVVAAMYLR